MLEKANHRGRYHPYVGLNTDIEWGNNWSNETNQANNANRQAIYGYDLLPTNGEMNTSGSSADAYSPYYTAIERANLNIKNLRQYGNIENNADMAYLLGEALTLRAVMYYDLIRWNLLKTKMDETKQKLNDLNNWTGDFSYLAQGDGYVYYKVEGTKLEMYGLGRDEQTAPDATWIPYTNTEGEVSRYAPCASNTESPKFTTAEINRLYDRDPDTRQYWPIFQSVVDNSQGQIHNDYGY